MRRFAWLATIAAILVASSPVAAGAANPAAPYLYEQAENSPLADQGVKPRLPLADHVDQSRCPRAGTSGAAVLRPPAAGESHRQDSDRIHAEEPYARVLANGTVQLNERSPAVYLNTTFYGNVTVPASADPADPPEWVTVYRSGRFQWHDHRIHWTSTALPPQVKDKSSGPSSPTGRCRSPSAPSTCDRRRAVLGAGELPRAARARSSRSWPSPGRGRRADRRRAQAAPRGPGGEGTAAERRAAREGGVVTRGRTSPHALTLARVAAVCACAFALHAAKPRVRTPNCSTRSPRATRSFPPSRPEVVVRVQPARRRDARRREGVRRQGRRGRRRRHHPPRRPPVVDGRRPARCTYPTARTSRPIG